MITLTSKKGWNNIQVLLACIESNSSLMALNHLGSAKAWTTEVGSFGVESTAARYIFGLHIPALDVVTMQWLDGRGNGRLRGKEGVEELCILLIGETEAVKEIGESTWRVEKVSCDMEGTKGLLA